MSRRPNEKLTDEDRVLWNLVARSATPLRGKRAVEVPEIVLESENTPPKPAPVPSALGTEKPVPPRHPLHPLDKPTLEKLAKGRTPIEGRVDLHGMTQDEAYSLLYSFLHRAHAGGVRYVLVITGKGSSSGGDGVLRRSVPAWLSTPAFRPLVSSHDHAARHHGGSGALYVRLRRTRP
jgi:DNA-nicking Smr family endonuclease